MTDHVVIQVRDEVVSRLKAGVAAVSDRVYLMHEVPPEEIDASNSPFLVVQVGDDGAELIGVNGASSAPAVLEDLNLALFVHCVVKMDGDAEKTAYGLRADAETALLATDDALTLGGKVVTLTRVAAANNRDEALDQGAYAVALQLEAKIRHLEGSPTSFTY